MFGKHTVPARLFLFMAAALLFLAVSASPTLAYRMCTFKGTVLDHGWRTMVVKSGGQCATLNVGWRTKYIPNRRPCKGEAVAVDFVLDDGYMKAVKVVSLTTMPSSVTCYPPAPPRDATCRSVPDDSTTDTEPCADPQGICSRTPPPHVRDSTRSSDRPAVSSPGGTSATKRPIPATKPKPVAKPATKPGVIASKERPDKPIEKVTPPAAKEDKKSDEPVDDKSVKSMTGEVVASSPKSLSIRSAEEGGSAEVVNVKVGLKTKFIPFRRPAVGERVKVEYKDEGGARFGYTVQVVQ
jgi:hypothetical protein